MRLKRLRKKYLGHVVCLKTITGSKPALPFKIVLRAHCYEIFGDEPGALAQFFYPNFEHVAPSQVVH